MFPKKDFIKEEVLFSIQEDFIGGGSGDKEGVNVLQGYF